MTNCDLGSLSSGGLVWACELPPAGPWLWRERALRAGANRLASRPGLHPICVDGGRSSCVEQKEFKTVTKLPIEPHMTLCDYEIQVLRCCAGEHVEGLAWGAAMSVALETLESAGLVERPHGSWRATARGRCWLAEELAQRDLARATERSPGAPAEAPESSPEDSAPPQPLWLPEGGA